MQAKKYDILTKNMCYDCGRILSSPIKIKVRLKSFTVEKTYMCPKCGEYVMGTYFDTRRILPKIRSKIDVFLNK